MTSPGGQGAKSTPSIEIIAREMGQQGKGVVSPERPEHLLTAWERLRHTIQTQILIYPTLINLGRWGRQAVF